MLLAGSRKRERVLVYGDSGTGKSSCWVALADWYRRGAERSSEGVERAAHIWVLDSDQAADANLPEDGSLDPYVTCLPLSEDTFDGWREAAKKVKKEVRRDDWVVVDRADHAWRAVQNHFWNEKDGRSAADVFAASVISGDRGKEIAGPHGENWGVINAWYFEFMGIIVSMPCHVLLCAGEKEITGVSSEGDIEEWKRYKAKPEGQKGLSQNPHTVLHLERQVSGGEFKYRMTTVKEKGPIGHPKRAELKGEVVKDFVLSYLVKVAKWKL